MRRLSHFRTASLILLTGAVVLGATACGSKSGGSSSSPAPAAGGGSSQAKGTVIDVTLKDFSITVNSMSSMAPGLYTFHVTNQGPASHNLTVNGPGVTNQGTSTLSAGGSEDLTVTLANGTYELYCSVPGHKQLGMDTKLAVGSGGSGGGGSSGGGGGGSGGSSSSGGGWA